MVVVGEPSAVFKIEINQRDIAVVFDDHIGMLDRITQQQVIDAENMSLIIEPIEEHLKSVVQGAEPHRFTHQEPPPDTRSRARHIQSQRIHFFGSLLLGRSHPIEDRDHRA